MNILIASETFLILAGPEMYQYELSRELRRRGHQVSIQARRSSPEAVVVDRARRHGVQCADFRTSLWCHDVLHLNQTTAGQAMLRRYPRTPAIQTIHAEWARFERPIDHPNVRYYVAIRPSIYDLLVRHGVPKRKLRVIYNPVDRQRFTPAPDPARRTVLFAAAFGKQRFAAVTAVRELCRREGATLRLIGAAHADCPLDGQPIEPPRWDMEIPTRACSETAGILLGRTTLEGWACGKPGWIVDVGRSGNVKGIERVPPPADLSFCDARVVAEQLLDLYERVA